MNTPLNRRLGAAGAAFLLMLGLVACDPFHTEFDPIEPAVLYRAAEVAPSPTAATELRVMTWNVKFGGGRIDFFFDCHGDAVLMEESTVLGHMAGLADAIETFQPDILLLQEVDILSKRSAYVDMVQYLLDHTHLSWGAYASQWRADTVPQAGVGKVDSGNAILSRWPLVQGRRIALPLVASQSGITQYFYLKRNVLEVRVDVPWQDNLWAIVTHAEAFSTDGTKQRHVDKFAAVIADRVATGALVVAGGDLNSLPPGTTKLNGFDDSVCVGEFEADDYSGEEDWLATLYATYETAIALTRYQGAQEKHASHTTEKDGFWNRKLDYLFTNGRFVPGSGVTHQDVSTGVATMPLSDHAPITVMLEVRP